jgi:tetratricopeptide (TPR) repeat protein
MSESALRPPTSPWLFSPVVDLLVGCGLLALPLGLLFSFVPAEQTSLIVIGTGALAVVVNGPHYAATIVRALHHDRRARVVLAVASVVAVVAAVAAHVWPLLLAALFTAYVTWSPWHYATQNHGVAVLLLARAGGPSTTAGERRALKAAHVIAALAAIAAIHTGLSEAFLRRLGLSPDVAFATAVVATIVAVGLGGGVLWRLRRRGASAAALLTTAALLSTSLVWFVVPGVMEAGSSLIYVSGAAALLHCAQYLWITGFVEGRLAQVTGRRFDGLAFFGTVVALGVGLFTAGPWLVSRGFGYDLIVSLMILQAVVNLHHFVVDAFVWKFRDPALAGPLFSGRELADARRAEVSNLKAVGATVVVGAFVIVGAVDVVQLAGTRPDASEDAWARALALNPNDSRLWVQNAQRAVAHNDADQARADLGRAVALSPYNVDAQRALLRLHAVTGHLDEAWARKSAVPAGILDDVDSSVVLADVALKLGRFEEAATLGERAVAAVGRDDDSASGIEARRVLGMARFELGRHAEALHLLRGALEDGEILVGGNALQRGALLELGVTLARTHQALKAWDPAQLLFERILEGATATNRGDVAVDALLGQAAIALQRQQPREALDFLQRALKVAEATTVSAVSAVSADRVARGWLDYGGLLAASEAPMRLRFACAVKARRYAEGMRDGERKSTLLTFIDEATAFVEEVLPADERERVLGDPDAAANEALGLAYPDTDDEE